MQEVAFFGFMASSQPPYSMLRRERSKQFQEPFFSRNLRLVEVLRGIGGQHGKSPGS
jgi:hypothetical protein